MEREDAPSLPGVVTALDYPGLLSHDFIAPSWPRPADEPEVSLFHDGTCVVSPQQRSGVGEIV